MQTDNHQRRSAQSSVIDSNDKSVLNDQQQWKSEDRLAEARVVVAFDGLFLVFLSFWSHATKLFR